MMLRSVVVLPAPLRPMRHTSSPAPTASETARRILLVWMSTTTLSSVSMSYSHLRCRLDRHLADHGRNERRVAEERRRRAVGEHLARLQRDNAARIFRDEIHVVLDQDDRLHARAPCRLDQRSHDAVLV